MRRGRCAVTHLRAQYFDTPEHDLATAGFVLRLRREGRRWVQAIKGPGEGVLSRLEHEVDLGAGPAMPSIDPRRHVGAPGFAAFEVALGAHAGALAAMFAVDVQRTHRVVHSQGGVIEIALDEGRIASAGGEVPVCELEFELVSGSLAGLTELARRWAARLGLWLDVRTKSERGWLLVRGEAASPAVRGKPPRLSADITTDAALRLCVGAALDQVLPNAAAIAAGVGNADHVHQARVGLRRALSVLREFGDWSPAVDAQWSVRLSSAFKALGETRDRDVLSGWLLPELQQAGGPALQVVASLPSNDPGEALRAPEFTCSLLELLGFAHAGTVSGPAQPASTGLLAQGGPILARLHRRLRRAGKVFAALDDAQRHRARRQLKRLRYCAESLSSLFPARAWQRYASRLSSAQEALGRFQDLSLAEAVLREQLEHEPGAWFARGWIAGRRPLAVAQAGAALSALGKLPKWLAPRAPRKSA